MKSHSENKISNGPPHRTRLRSCPSDVAASFAQRWNLELPSDFDGRSRIKPRALDRSANARSSIVGASVLVMLAECQIASPLCA